MLRDKVFFIGLRYEHHAAHSGYEAFNRYVGTPKPPPVNFRWTLGRWGWTLNGVITRLTRHRWYSLGAFVTELAAFSNMVLHRGRLYHILYGDSDLWMLRCAHRITGHRLVASFHQPTADLRALNIIERVARRLDGVILVSETQRAYFEEFLPPEKIFVVPHGVDSQYFRPGDQPKTDTLTCVTLGSHLRDFETFAEAVRLVWSSNPEVHFILVGSQREKNPALMSLEGGHVTFLDRISDGDLLWTLQTSHVGVFSFAAATANNALLEAMAAGLPIVATNAGGIGEYVPVGGGILVPERDARAMAEAILRVLGDRDEATRMSRICRERAEALDFSLIADRMRQVYDSVLQVS